MVHRYGVYAAFCHAEQPDESARRQFHQVLGAFHVQLSVLRYVRDLLHGCFRAFRCGRRTYRWIYIVVTFGFLVFLSMVNFMKKIVEFAEKEEWNQPRRPLLRSVCIII